MNHKQDLIKELLESLEYLEAFHEPPETIAPRFAVWLSQVTTAFEAAGMNHEYGLWQDSLSGNEFSDDSSLPALMHSKKAILLGILDKLYGGEPSEDLLPTDIFQNAREYIRLIVNQINGCYERGWYDPCAVMVRRLIETLIIECFEHYSIQNGIKNSEGNYLALGELVTRFLNETAWNLSRNTKSSLPRLKEIGDMSAHNRYYIARRRDLVKHSNDIRTIAQELLYIGTVAKV